MQEVDPTQIVTAGKTDVGKVRSSNQDAIGEFVHPESPLLLLVVADGMGGHRGGEVASQLAIDTVGRVFRNGHQAPADVLRRAIETANGEVNRSSREDESLAGMGTTCVAMLFGEGGQAWVAHVGDSRAYRLRNGMLIQLTADHSVVGELERMGRITAEEARTHPQRNEILRAIGTQDSVSVDLSPIPFQPGDRYLLCSDGLSGMLTDDEIADVLGSATPEEAARTLVERANERGGVDNISVQIALIPTPPPEPLAAVSESASLQTGIPGLMWAALAAAGLLLLWLLFGP